MLRTASLRLVLCLLVGFLFLDVPDLAAEGRPFTVHDLLEMKRVSDPQPSPSGDEVVFTVRTTDLDANRGRTDIWRVGIDGEGLRRLTSHEASDFHPRWSPDGKSIFFLSSRSGSYQIWRLFMDGGEAFQVSDLPLDVGNLVVAPKGNRLAFTLDVFPDCEDLECTVTRQEAKQAGKTTGLLYDQLFVRHWDTWKDGRRSHLYVLDFETTGDQLRALTPGFDGDVPSKPFGGAEEIAFGADGKTLFFSAREAGKTEPWSTDFDIYSVPVDGSAAPAVLTDANRAWDTQPVASPDGKTLAYLAMARPGFEADRFRVVLRDLETGRTRTLTEDWDRSPGSITFAADGETIYATAGDLGQGSIFAIDVATGSAERRFSDGRSGSLSVIGDRLLFSRSTLAGPSELFTTDLAGNDLKAVTTINDGLVAAIDWGDFEQFTFPGWNDETVHAYVVKPAGFEEGKKYPVAFLIHGGPQGSFGNNFHYRWNPQTYAGAGFAAVMVDFHGSTGYGQEFTDSITGDWGGKPLVDLQKGLAAAVERYDFLDGDRVCAAGASYGGYMINWIAGQWPDRFRCLVNHDGVFDNRMMYFATEELWFPEWEHGGTYWASREGFEKHNPVDHVEKWRAPMLVIHGALDYRVPDTQGLAAFTALQRQGIESQLLYFPDENHWVLQPANSIQWHETVNAWLHRWLDDE